MAKLITVVETPEFVRQAARIFTELERWTLVNMLAATPGIGDLIPGTGGFRKLRWAAKGKGKSGGARVVYLFHRPQTPVFLVTAYPKDEKADLSQAERNELKKLSATIIETYRSTRNARTRRR